MNDPIEEGQITEPEVSEEPDGDMPTPEQDGSDELEEEVEQDDLPEDTSARTREEFEKLKERNKAMSEQLSKYEKKEAQNALEDVFGSLPKTKAPTMPPAQGQAPAAEDFIDDEGNVDIRGLRQALNQANYTAAQAAQIAQQTAQMAESQRRESQVREAHSKHPWLDPQSDQFDEDLFGLVRDRLVRNFAEGTEAPLVEVADQIARRFRQEAEEEKTTVSKSKAQSTSTQRGKGQPRSRVRVDVDELRARAQRGDNSAVDALIALATEK